MRTLIFSVCVGIFLSLTSCFSERPVARQVPGNNETYKVDYLFEHEGCKVYRFYDRGSYVYFTNCNGNVTAIASDSTKHRVETITRTDIDR
ncbi:MAG: DUF4884 domain-containing protein [Dysgonomonas sp.]|nr:DUF4884 domain-containing protein [Dysgonomonas sp.]